MVALFHGEAPDAHLDSAGLGDDPRPFPYVSGGSGDAGGDGDYGKLNDPPACQLLVDIVANYAYAVGMEADHV